MIKHSSEQGLVLIIAMILLAAMTLISLSLLSQSGSQYQIATTASAKTNATYTAEAGIEQSLQELNEDSNFTGYSNAKTFFNNTSQGVGTYTTTVAQAPGNSNAKIITSTGKVSRFTSPDKSLATRTVQVTVVGTGAAGYSVITGPGGLILGGNANIVNSPVYVGGTITLNGASKIGTAAKPLKVDVSNNACPSGNNPGPSYPSVCSSSQPLSLAQSTVIYGSVCATGQTNTGPNNNIQKGNGGQGLINGCVAPTVEIPPYDKTEQVGRVSITSAGNNNTYVCNSSPFTRVWPANLKLTGNVTLEGSCDITLNGDVYITGNLTLKGASVIRIADSVGATRPTMLVDGIVDVGASAAVNANSSGTSLAIVSFASNAACGSNCTSLSGTALKSTSTYETVKVGGAAKVPGVVFDAHWGKVTVGGSGNVGSVTGQTVDLSGAGTVTFGTVLSAGTSTWTITSYQIKYP